MFNLIASAMITATRMDDQPATFNTHEDYKLFRENQKRRKERTRQELDIAFLQRW